MKQHKEESLTVTVPQAARLLGIGRNSAYVAIERGDIPHVRIGKRIVVPRAALERLLACDSFMHKVQV